MSMDKRYLEEDKDILDRLEELSIPMKYHESEFLRFQIKATLRNRKSLEDFNSATTRFSIILVMLAFVQIVIAWFAFMVSLEALPNLIIKVILIVSLGGMLIYIFKNFTKDINH